MVASNNKLFNSLSLDVVTWDVDGDVSIAVIQMVTREQSTPSPDEDQQEAAETSRSTPQVITSWDTIIKMKVFFKYVRIPLFWLGGGGKGGKCLFEERRFIERGAYSVFFLNVIVTLCG